jgi:hypothetical protein
MKEKASGLGMKALALLVLLIAAWVLFKLVLGFVTAVAWIVVVVLAVVALGWALVTLMR